MSWFWWIIGTFGLGGAVLAVLIFMFSWPVVLQAVLNNRLVQIAMAAGAAGLAVFGVYLKGRSVGRAAERERLKKLTEKEVDNAAIERQRIDALTDAEVDKELARWSR